MSRAIVGRFVSAAVLVVIAIMAVGAQLDRATLRQPALASMVPGPMRSYALYALVDEAMQSGDKAGAYAAGTKLVRRRPVPAEGLSALAIAAQNAGHPEEAVQALALAASRGWRDVLSQRATAFAAIEGGNWPVAAQRAAALWRLGDGGGFTDDGRSLDAITASVLHSPVARPIFLGQIATAPVVVGSFTNWAGDHLDAATLEPTMATLRTSGAHFDCEVLSDTVAKVAWAGKIDAAAKMWAAACNAPGKQDPLRLGDYAFRTSESAAADPLDWNYPDAGGLDRSFSSPDKGGVVRMQFTNGNPIRVTLASRLVALSPGTHSVAALGAMNVAVQLALTCVDENGSSGPHQRVALDGTAQVAVSAQHCKVQRLDLLGPPGSGSIAGIKVD